MAARKPLLGSVEINASTVTQNANVVTAPLAQVRANGAASLRRGDAREKESQASIWSSGEVKRTMKGSRLEQIAQKDRRKISQNHVGESVTSSLRT